MAENQLDSLSGEKSPPHSSCPADIVLSAARTPEAVLLAGDDLTFVVAEEVGSEAAGAPTGSASFEDNRVNMMLC